MAGETGKVLYDKALKEKDPEERKKLLEKALEKKYPLALFGIAQLYLDQKFGDDALENYKKIIELYKESYKNIKEKTKIFFEKTDSIMLAIIGNSDIDSEIRVEATYFCALNSKELELKFNKTPDFHKYLTG